MKLAKYEPRSEMFKPLNLFDELATWHGLFNMLPSAKTFNSIAMDINEDDKYYYVKADVPGFSKEDIEISLDKELLTIKGTMKETKEQNEKTYLRRERTESNFERTIKIYDEIDSSKIEAKLENGILNLTLPKKNTKENTVRTITVK